LFVRSELDRVSSTEAGVVMCLIVPSEKCPTELLAVFDAAEAPWKTGLVFQGFGVALRERIVVGGMRAAVRSGDTEIGEQERRCFCLHRTATVSMQSELSWGHLMLGDGVMEQSFEQGRTFSISDAPTDNPATEDVDDDVEIEIGPLGWALELCDVPGPNFVWTHGLVQVWCRQDDAVACGAHGLRY
jgi:hypothetical protein